MSCFADARPSQRKQGGMPFTTLLLTGLTFKSLDLQIIQLGKFVSVAVAFLNCWHQDLWSDAILLMVVHWNKNFVATLSDSGMIAAWWISCLIV